MSKFSTKAVCNFTKRLAYKVVINSTIAIVTTASTQGSLPNWDDLPDILRKSLFVAVQQEVIKHLHPKKQNVKPVLTGSKNEKGDR